MNSSSKTYCLSYCLILACIALEHLVCVEGAGITTEVGAPLGTISDCDMTVTEEGDIPTCTLPFGVYEHFGPTSSFTTRNYLGGGFPAPIIRVRAGDSFNVHLINQLEDTNNQPMVEMNLPHLPNTTNFHTVKIRLLTIFSPSLSPSVFLFFFSLLLLTFNFWCLTAWLACIGIESRR
jgi:hypothetical protein